MVYKNSIDWIVRDSWAGELGKWHPFHNSSNFSPICFKFGKRSKNRMGKGVQRPKCVISGKSKLAHWFKFQENRTLHFGQNLAKNETPRDGFRCGSTKPAQKRPGPSRPDGGLGPSCSLYVSVILISLKMAKLWLNFDYWTSAMYAKSRKKLRNDFGLFQLQIGHLKGITPKCP